MVRFLKKGKQMNSELNEKLYSIAEHLGDLNSYGKVKANPYHEYGYAKIYQVKPGCSFWIHHWNNDSLRIDLLISETAKKRYPSETKISEQIFKNLFSDKVQETVWRHSDGKGKDHKHFYINVEDENIDNIKSIIMKIKSIFT